MKFGRLRVIAYVGPSPGNKKAVWECQCDCGNLSRVFGHNLIRGRVVSCGCFRKEWASKCKATSDSGLNKLIGHYKTGACKKNLPFELLKEDFKKLTKQTCHYCGRPPEATIKKCSDVGTYIYNGIDRTDPILGYTLDNCVTCCKACNCMKATKSYEEFLNLIKAIYIKHFEKKTSFND